MPNIFIFGPSCSGKSTLSQALYTSLGDTWTYIDRDELIEKGVCRKTEVNQTIDQKIKEIKDRVIVDAQVPWREKKEGEFYFLILPPLQILLERDQKRTTNLKRSDELAKRAKMYVLNTYETLKKIPQGIFNKCFDSSQLSLEEEVQQIRNSFVFLGEVVR
ncbi:MAG: hypothetical protein L0207_00725 [Chlamydiae bacterium]|nr:hypothetical protein [Chlamydiota bacterium]